MRALKKRSNNGVTTWAGPCNTARGRWGKQEGGREGTCHYGDRHGTCCGVDHPGSRQQEQERRGSRGSRRDRMGQRPGKPKRRYHQEKE